MNRYILETKELTKKFGRQKAVANLSLQIEKNSVYGLWCATRQADNE